MAFALREYSCFMRTHYITYDISIAIDASMRWCNHGTLAMAFLLQINARKSSLRWHLTAFINVEPNYLIAGAHRVDGHLHANSTNSYIFRTTSKRENIFIFVEVDACAIILMLLYVCLLHVFHLVVTISSIFFSFANFIFKELLRNVHFGKQNLLFSFFEIAFIRLREKFTSILVTSINSFFPQKNVVKDEHSI